MEPELILFGEPTQGLDPVLGALIDELIINLTERTKTTSIIVTHLMDSAFHVATRMAMLHRGKIIEQGTPEHMRQSKNQFLVQFLSGTTEGPVLERSKYHMLSPGYWMAEPLCRAGGHPGCRCGSPPRRDAVARQAWWWCPCCDAKPKNEERLAIGAEHQMSATAKLGHESLRA